MNLLQSAHLPDDKSGLLLRQHPELDPSEVETLVPLDLVGLGQALVFPLVEIAVGDGPHLPVELLA